MAEVKGETTSNFETKYPVERVLFELYRTRGLTKDQLARSIFAGTSYIVSYLTKLQKKGLVGGKVLSKGKIRLAKLYQITDKGIELLENKGLVLKYNDNERSFEKKKPFDYEDMKQAGVYIPRKVLAYDNNQSSSKDKMMFTLYANQMYAGVSEYGFYFFDSREWKLKYDLNRNAMVRGGISTEDGIEYSVYMLFTTEEVRIASMSDKMLYRMMHEMIEFPQTSRHIIYVYGGQDEYNKVLTFFKNNPVACDELLIIPHGASDVGLNIIRLLQNREMYKEHMELHLNARLNSEVLEHDTSNLYADYLTEINGQSYYVIDYIKLNEAKLSMLLREYTPDKYHRTGIPVMILCWNAMGNELREYYKLYPYVKIVEMDIQSDLNNWVAELEKKKLYLRWQ